MKRIGITGGIGSGKSTVSKLFGILGIPVYDADSRAKKCMQEDATLVAQIRKIFGPEAYTKSGAVNRAYLAHIVFNDAKALEKLNAIVHPAVFRDFRAWCASQDQNLPYVLKEAALTFETGSHAMLDATILVWAPEAVRIKRVMRRDRLPEEAVRKRMEKQWTDAEKMPMADFILINDGAHSIIRQVTDFHRILKNDK